MAKSSRKKAKARRIAALVGVGSLAAAGAVAGVPAPAGKPDKRAPDAGVAPATEAAAATEPSQKGGSAKKKEVRKVDKAERPGSDFDADLAMPAGTLYDVISRRSFG